MMLTLKCFVRYGQVKNSLFTFSKTTFLFLKNELRKKYFEHRNDVFGRGKGKKFKWSFTQENPEEHHT